MRSGLPVQQTVHKAAVAVFAFNRPDTLAATLSNLERATEFEGRSVYLFCDGFREARESEMAAVGEVRKLLQMWATGKKDVTCHFADRNRGLRESITGGVSRVLQSHDRVIILEDDIVCSRSFLTYMDRALEAYSSTRNVWQISGYFVPDLWGSRRAGFMRMPACWGWATWRDRWNFYNDNAAELLTRVAEADINRFNFENSYHFFSELERNAVGTLNTWHIRWYASMFLADALALYPGRSLTRNIGFDSRGTNCHAGRMATIYARQSLWHGNPTLPQVGGNALESESLAKRQIRFHHFQQAVWTRSTLKDRIEHRLRRLFPALRER
jgi:hypothetical protein